MEISLLLKEILKKDSLSPEDIILLLSKVGISASHCSCKVLFYKSIEKALVLHYKEAHGIDLMSRIYSVNEIHGLMLFLYIKEYGLPEVDPDLERFFEGLFFSSSGEAVVSELREENERLVRENEELRNKMGEMNNLWIDRGFEEPGLRNVDNEVLSRMEKELTALKEQVDFEHSSILEAWYRLGEDYIRNKH